MSVASHTLVHMITTTAWVRPRPNTRGLRADTLGALLLALGAVTSSLLYQRIGLFDEENLADPWLWAVGLGLATLPLALRRRYPVPVALVVSIGFFICGQFGVPEALFINICLFIAIYTIGAWESHRVRAFWGRFAITAAMLIWVVIDLMMAVDSEVFPGLSRSGIFSAYATWAVIQILTNLMYFGGAIFFGEKSWRAARTLAELEAQGKELEIERRISAEQAVALDRLGIARELHDVVAHHVSVMGIQAAAARRSLARDQAQAERALSAIETSAQSTIEELRGLVHTLRSPEAESGASAVGIAGLPALIAASQSAGTPASLIVSGEPRPLPMLVDVALYRVVQEALTNVRKHAGKGASAEVRLRFSHDAVEVEITDDGVRQQLGTAHGTQMGLRGMRERIGAVGGTVEAGRRERGGFMVRASVPIASEPLSPVAAQREASPQTAAQNEPPLSSAAPVAPASPSEQPGKFTTQAADRIDA